MCLLDSHPAEPPDRRIVDGMTAPKLSLVQRDQLLDLSGIAALLGLALSTVRNYHQISERRRREGTIRPGDFPEPAQRFGRSPAWELSVIRAWQDARPGQGAGGGRPRKGGEHE